MDNNVQLEDEYDCELEESEKDTKKMMHKFSVK